MSGCGCGAGGARPSATAGATIGGVTPCACGCCAGEAPASPHFNAPGLPAIEYRIGTHPDFLARMRSRIHAWEVLTCARCDETFAGPERLRDLLTHIALAHPEEPNPGDLVVARRPLAPLGTRSPEDPAIALMDAWAVTADVVTFYQERIANEAFLRTATERRSVLSLARAIGYQLDPGVAAESYLAFTVDDAAGSPTASTVPAGTQVLSIPAKAGELPQTFETDAEITARVAWNALRPRPHSPHRLSSALSHVYLHGVATGVRAGQLLLMLLGGSPTVRHVGRVTLDAAAGRTRVDFAEGNAAPSTDLPDRPVGVLDPAQSLLPLTPDNVRAHVFERRWTERDLQAFLTMHAWDAAEMLACVDDLRARSFDVAGQELLAFRDRLGFFGHNAPFFASLPDLESSPFSSGKAWQFDWDAMRLSIWQDSVAHPPPQTAALALAAAAVPPYYLTDDDPYDVHLERPVQELGAGGFAVVEGTATTRVYRILRASESSRAGFGMSGKVTGLRLAHPDGAGLANVPADKPGDLHFRRTTISVRSESLSLAPVPVADDLAAGTTRIQLGTMALGLHPGQVVALQGVELSTDGAVRSEIAVLDEITHENGYTTLHLEAGLRRGYLRDTVALNANVVLASHGETVADEVLGSGSGSARHPRFSLARTPLTHRSAVGGSEAELEVRVNGVRWDQVRSLHGSGPTDPVYTVRIDDDASASILFGDGRAGATLPTGSENVRATYRSGTGRGGEVGAGALTLLRTRPLGIRSVTNPLAASGADDPETLDDARANAPLTVLTLDRVVSLQDYEDFARAYPGIGKARAERLWSGGNEIVHLTVADAVGGEVAEPLFGRLLASIEAARDPLRPLRLASGQRFLFYLTASVLADPAHLWADVEAALRRELAAAFSFEARGFAQPVSAAEIVQVMHRVPGVIGVDIDELYRASPDETPSGGLLDAVLEARPARWDEGTESILPAELLLVHEAGIDLTPMTA